MPYQSDTISTIIGKLNRQYFLPAIQREFVWQPDQIIQLFDSLLRGYPISSFLFWQLKHENKDKWEVYKFVDAFKQGGTHNQLANVDGVHDLTLVLDGQQRLTALLIGLKGSFTIKKKYMWWDNPDAWVKQTLHLDLLKDPQGAEDDVVICTSYGFKSLDKVPEPDDQHYWFKVGKILAFESQKSFDDRRWAASHSLPNNVNMGQARVFEQTLEALYRAIWKDPVISYYTEHDQEYDRVLDIFVRANEGGTKLTKSDLLLSMVTAKWGEVNAREEIYGFVDELNTNLTAKNNFDKDFVMKSCLVLCDLPVQYKVENFSNSNLERIRTNWSGVKKAIRTGVDLANTFGIDRDTLTSTNALIPLLYYLYKDPAAKVFGTTPAGVQNASLIRRWLLMALVNNVYTGASDNALRDSRKVLQDHLGEAEVPPEAVSAMLATTGRNTRFNDDTIDNVLAKTYGSRDTFLALSLLYDDNNWGTMPYHQDHIFPQSMFTRQAMERIGIDDVAQTRYLAQMNRLGNLELLLGQEKVEKSNQPFDRWITSRGNSFRQRHLIPDDPNLLRFDQFEQFMAARESLIPQRLKTMFLLVHLAAG